MIFKDVLKSAFPIIEKSAPMLASVIGSPVAGIGTSWALSLLANAFDIQPNEIDKLSDVINNDPNSHDKISDIENTFKSWFVNHSHTNPPSDVEINIKMKWDCGKSG